MKKMENYSQVCAYLEKMYMELNVDMFGGELEVPFITVQASTRTYGHVTVDKVWSAVSGDRYELSISAEYLNRPIENIVATLLHGMVHIYNLMRGIRDTSRNGQYHNSRFKETAEGVGLIVLKSDIYGWSLTWPGDNLRAYIQKKKWEKIPFVRKGGIENADSGISEKKIKKPSSTRKYVCPNCGQSIRATRIVNIICGDCEYTMILETT